MLIWLTVMFWKPLMALKKHIRPRAIRLQKMIWNWVLHYSSSFHFFPRRLKIPSKRKLQVCYALASSWFNAVSCLCTPNYVTLLIDSKQTNTISYLSLYNISAYLSNSTKCIIYTDTDSDTDWYLCFFSKSSFMCFEDRLIAAICFLQHSESV